MFRADLRNYTRTCNLNEQIQQVTRVARGIISRGQPRPHLNRWAQSLPSFGSYPVLMLTSGNVERPNLG